MKIIKKEGGRIPFAYMFAIIFVLMLLLAGIYANILGRHNLISIDKFYEESDQDLRNINDMVREKAYHTLMEVIHNVTKQRDPKLYMIQEYLQKDMAKYINATFPIVTQNYEIKVNNYTVKVVMDYKKTRAFIKNFKLKWIDYTYGLDNLQEGYENHTQMPVYPYVVGYFNYTYHDRRSGFVMKRSMVFNRIVYSPLPLLKFEFDEFKTSTTNLGDFGRMVKYILTTIVEYRILKGYAAGGYAMLSVPVTDVLTKDDVEHAVNLALLLESVRFFGTYDQNMANQMGIAGILDKYIRSGTIDAADLYYLWKGFDSTHINFFSVARIIGQSIYSYADRFVFELLKVFWGNSLSDYFADPTLKEPLLNWNKVKEKGDGWIAKMVTKFLDKWRQWLLIPKFILPHFAKVSIKQKFKIIIILPHFPYIKIEHKTVVLHWYIFNMPVMNTVDLIRGSNLKYFELYALGTSSDPPFAHLGHYKYKLVKQTFGEEHGSYSGSGGSGSPCYNTFQYVIDALTRSMKDKSDKWNNETSKGFVDYAAYETSLVSMMFGNGGSIGSPNPKDNQTILIDGTQKMIQPLQKATNMFKGLTWLRKETWWMYGAYKDYRNKSQSLAYLYYLSRDTVDLWYQAMKNLYDGGDPSPTDDAGPYSFDCNHFPKSNQVSTWPTPYSGYPFYGHGNHNGSFNFQRDLTRDAYNDLRLLMWEKALLEGAKKGGVGIPVYSHSKVWKHVKNSTEDAREKVVGKKGLIKNLNFMMFMPYINKAYAIFKKFDTLRAFLDYITGNGSYKTWADSSSSGGGISGGGVLGGSLSNFYKFVRGKVGYQILGFTGVPPTNKSVNDTNPGGNNTTNVTGLGLDVSHWQGTIDWQKVHDAGYSFVFVKSSQGTGYVDPKFASNVRNAYSAGLQVGAYHFATPSDSATAEADHFVNTIKPYMSYLTLPPALDLEQTGGHSWSSLSSWANDFMKEVQSQLGVTPVIYINVNYARHLDSSVTQWPLWIADRTYDPNATPRTGKWGTWTFWQYSDKGSVPGISGSSVDLDKAAGRAGAMSPMYDPFLSFSLGGLLGKVPGWLSESFNVLQKNVELNARYSSIPIFPMMHSPGTRVFWDSTYYKDSIYQRTKSESTVVNFQPSYLSAGSNLQISVALGSGHRFVDVQDPDYDMGEAPFEYQYTVSIHGTLNLNLRTERTSLVYGGIHWLTWYNGTVPIDLNLKIPVYSAWYLESKWHAVNYHDDWNLHTDVPFSYTRGYFNVLGKDTPTKPFFISKPLNSFIYDYEKIGEIWNRYATFSNFALVNIKDELPAWNYTYHRIILNATAEVVKGINAASNGFATAQSDANAIQISAKGYLKQFRFFYFSRDFILNGTSVKENNGYRQFTVSLDGKTVKEIYHEGQFSVQGEITGGGANLNMSHTYDNMRISLAIQSGDISPTFVSYSSVSGRTPRMYVESLDNVVRVDFGLVGDSGAVSGLAKYMHFSVGRGLTQESLIKAFHEILKNIYLNDTPLSYKFGIFVKVMGAKDVTYIVWNDQSPTTDSYIIWLTNEVRSIVYKVGISQFPQHGYDRLTSDSVYYSVNNLWLDTDYESSSIFGYATQGKARASSNGYTLTLSYSL